MVRHQMVPSIHRSKCEAPIARKHPPPENIGRQTKRTRREEQEKEEQKPKSCRKSLRLSHKKPLAANCPTDSHYAREQKTRPNRKRYCENQTYLSDKRPQLLTSKPVETPSAEERVNISNLSKADLIGYCLATSTNTPGQESREGKSAKYRRATYETVLATLGSYMRKSELGITDKSKNICKNLLENEQPTPENTLFRDDTFEEFCQRLQGKNEPRVIQDIARLIVPSAESLAVDGAKDLRHLVESVNETWGSSIPFCGPRPQPDYAVGFGRSAFTDDQLKKFEPFLGYNPDSYSSFFLATFYMYFPFLTCEVKGTAALDVADRQNAHSMTLAVQGIVELFRLVKREEEVNREILAFSISHDHRTVRIYGHYAIVKEEKTEYYRHPIHTFDFTALDGKEKWTAYRFTRNIYEKWAPNHLNTILSALDEIPPGVNFDISDPGDSLTNAPSFVDANSQASFAHSMEVTPNTSFTQQTLKRQRKQ
ncbi:hypothetical protein CPC735_044320 [Coccidioides posadasii C735 delta SOWgp]|uniref:DUF7924 domain-containing protein n=1 Tax=Coccidioides posadasii (strain C735) TaxID=222929 RepID=C5PBK4_COCP7|nr:hypothetical protein CPC735_044320 [Coccidioides posadasii C735 delta SOWgp]EER25988.1 hypothetical protein CPC735_044320 [Coccidioides posadasii C735 delta SOWgp]|eukprot:XP_003068133.1 hypothetical protein CPC735_044320 [Coccidioides posadasii C735 delta SOWgp]